MTYPEEGVGAQPREDFRDDAAEPGDGWPSDRVDRKDNVTYMDSMFGYATSFNQPLNWNVSNVTYMCRMFWGARSFNQPLNNWNVSNVRGMDDMFKEATSFNHALHAPWYVVEQSESE